MHLYMGRGFILNSLGYAACIIDTIVNSERKLSKVTHPPPPRKFPKLKTPPNNPGSKLSRHHGQNPEFKPPR